jgi:DNA polymerase III, delta subunit
MSNERLEPYLHTVRAALVREFIQPLALSRTDIEALVGARLGYAITYEELPEIASPYLLVITPEKDGLSVEEARRITPLVTRVQDALTLVVIHAFDLATDQAANALLKIFEDGVPGVLFLLQIESEQALLDTIRSRIVVVSSDAVTVTARPQDREMIMSILAQDPRAVASYVNRKWITRAEALSVLVAAKEVLSERGVTGPIHGVIAQVYGEVLATNAILTYLMDRVLLELIEISKKN